MFEAIGEGHKIMQESAELRAEAEELARLAEKIRNLETENARLEAENAALKDRLALRGDITIDFSNLRASVSHVDNSLSDFLDESIKRAAARVYREDKESGE